jgi:thymidine kinase
VSIPKAPPGAVTVICGSMFSGKTEELIRLVRRAMHARKRVQVFKSSLDTRCETSVIRTHDDTRFNAISVPDTRTLEKLLEPGVQVVGIEEVQFLDDAIVPLCQRLADQGIQVIVAGLDQDFRGLPFSFMPQLMALADNVMKLHAICKVCGQEASRTQRLVDGRPAAWDEPTILIGADDAYEARCRRCHQIRRVPKQYQARVTTPTATTKVSSSVSTIRPLRPIEAHRNGNGSTLEYLHEKPPALLEVEDSAQLEMFTELPVDDREEPDSGGFSD